MSTADSVLSDRFWHELFRLHRQWRGRVRVGGVAVFLVVLGRGNSGHDLHDLRMAFLAATTLILQDHA